MSNQEELETYSPEYLAEDDSKRLIDTSIAAVVVITITYAMFLTSRLRYVERNHWEVWVLYPLSYLLCLGMCINSFLYVEVGGAGRHMAYWLINDQSVMVSFLKIRSSSEFLYMAGVTFPKVAILALYLRIFVERKVRIITWVVMGIVLTHWVASGVIAPLATCQPFAFKWDNTIPGGHCADLFAAYTYVSIPNIITDVAIAILPISTLYYLQMTRVRKMGVSLTFLMGSLGIIASVIRFVGYYRLDVVSDPWYLGIDMILYAMIETSAYFVCSCLPGMQPLVQKLYRTWRRSRLISHGRTGDSDSHHHISIPPSQSRTLPIGGENKNGFIQLKETGHRDYASGRVA